MHAFTLRPARPADAAALAALGERTFRDSFAAHNRPEDMDAYVGLAYGEALQASELADPEVAVLVAESAAGGEMIGYAVVRAPAAGATKAAAAAEGDEVPPCVTGPAPVELARLYVERAWHGHGVGEALMRGVVDAARARGGRTLWLGVWEHNPRARAFYAKWGFREVGEHPFPLGADLQRDLLLARPI